MEPKRHSGLAIAAFVSSLVGVLTLVGTFAVSAYIGSHHPQLVNQQSPVMMVLGLLMLVALLLGLLALGLAIAGLVKAGHKKGLALAGLVLALLLIGGFATLILLGLAAA